MLDIGKLWAGIVMHQLVQRGSYKVWEINMGLCPCWNLIILCLLIAWGMTFIFMVHLSFDAITLLIYDVMYDITTIP